MQVAYFVLMKILPRNASLHDARNYFQHLRFEESYASDDARQVELWQEENLDRLIQRHTLNAYDVMTLERKSMTSFGNLLTRNGSTPAHIFAYVTDGFPVGNVGDTLGPYLTGTCVFLPFLSDRSDSKGTFDMKG